jgi:hypothetical protein
MMIHSTVHIIIYKFYNITFISNRTLSYIRFVVNGSFPGQLTEPKVHTIKDVTRFSCALLQCSFLQIPPHSMQQHTINTQRKMLVFVGCLSNCFCHVAVNDGIKIIIIKILHLFIYIITPVGASNFSHLQNVQTGYETHPASYSMGNRSSFLGGKVAGA